MSNKRMACALALMMIGIYSWVTREDAVATQYSSCGRLGQQSPAQRTLVLHPSDLLGGGVAESLSRAGHRVFVLLDPTDRSSAEHAQLVSQYLRAELEPVYWRGGSNNVSSLIEIVDQHAISMVVDTRPLLLSTQPNRLALVQRLTEMKTAAGGKRTYIYTSGCTLHSLDAEAPQVEEALSSKVVLPPGGVAADFPPHVALSPEEFEAQLRSIGSQSRNNLNTILLRPGLLFGAGAWATSPLRSWIRDGASALQNGGRNAEVASLPFLGLHLNDLLGAFVAVCGASPASLNALSGDVYDLHDDTRISHAEVQKLFVEVAAAEGQRHAAATAPTPAAEEESNLAAVAGVDAESATVVATPKSNRGRKLAALSSGGGSAGAGVSAAAAAAGTGSIPAEWLNRPRCPPSKRSAGTFQTITRWKPAHKKINDAAMMHTYVQAIKHTLEAQEASRPTVHVSMDTV